jgi:hypothetical protein
MNPVRVRCVRRWRDFQAVFGTVGEDADKERGWVMQQVAAWVMLAREHNSRRNSQLTDELERHRFFHLPSAFFLHSGMDSATRSTCGLHDANCGD